MSDKKDTNPKDAVGVKKWCLSVVPWGPIAELGLAMLEGARKYGRHNYRTSGIRGSVYFDATMRHLVAWWEGQDIDPDSGLSHITKATACLVVLRDGMLNEIWEDDRPPKTRLLDDQLDDWNTQASYIIEQYPDPLPAHTDELKELSIPAKQVDDEGSGS